MARALSPMGRHTPAAKRAGADSVRARVGFVGEVHGVATGIRGSGNRATACSGRRPVSHCELVVPIDF